MDREQMAHFYAKGRVLADRARQFAAVFLGKRWGLPALFLAGGVLAIALYSALTAKDAGLHLKLRHSFRSAQVSVWIDGDLAYSGQIAGTARKKFGLFPTDSVQGSLSEILPVRAGEHSIRVRVSPEDAAAQEDSIQGDFSHNTERELMVSARASGVSLSWEGVESAPAEASSSPGWFSRYAGSLFLTIAGSIASALAGYAIKELPSRLRSNSSASPKVEG